MSIIVYTSKRCPYREHGKRLLTEKNPDYKVIDVANSDEERNALVEKSNGLRTVPQIFIDGKHIGGFDSLSKLNKDGKLDLMISKYLIKSPLHKEIIFGHSLRY